MLAALLATVLIVGYTNGSPMASQYIDSVLNTALKNEIHLLQLDPATLPDFSSKFEDKVFLIGDVKVKAKYFNGYLSGLSRVRRYSECYGPYQSFGAKNVNCTIVFDMLNINYEGKVKYGKMPKVNIEAKSNITTSMVFIEVAQIPPMPPTLKNFLYQQTGHQEVKHTGLGPLNKYMEALDDGFKSHVLAEVFNFMSQKFQNALNRAVAHVPLPY